MISPKDPSEKPVPLRAPEFHSRRSVQGTDEEEKRDADGGHDNAEDFKLVIGGHVSHAEN